MRARRALLLALVTAALAACSTTAIRNDARERLRAGQYEQALAALEKGLRQHPNDIELRAAHMTVREEAIKRLESTAFSARGSSDFEAAEVAARRLLDIEPSNARARSLLLDLARDRRSAEAVQAAEKAHAGGSLDAAQALVEAALKDDPRNKDLLVLQRRVDLDVRARDESSRARLSETRPVTLAFRDAGLQPLLEALSKATGVSFIVDKDVRQDVRATVFLRNTRIEDALELITRTNQLSMKVLNGSTVLIYPNTPDKQREYQDLLIRAFYLTNITAKQAAAVLQTMLKVRDPVIDERANLVIIRDTPEKVRVAERLLALQDFGEPEVMLEVEVLEINTSRLTELGIRVPDSFSLTPLSSFGTLTLRELQNLNSSRIGVTSPTVTFNLRRELGDTNILANPRIRAKNREKARVLIGDKLPVITSTATSTGFVSENVQYLDVGLKFEVEPLVHLDDDVSLKVNLEVSSLAREIKTSAGSLAYQIGTRSATTTLQLKDGQTQVLAGLINRAERTSANRIPGAGDLPVVGRLFASQRDETTRTEIVLSITPRVIRNIRRPDIHLAEFWSGSESHFRLRPLALTTISQPPTPRGATDERQSPGTQSAVAPSAVVPSAGAPSLAAPSAVAPSAAAPSAAPPAAPSAGAPATAAPSATAPPAPGAPPSPTQPDAPIQIAALNLSPGTQWGLRLDAPAGIAAGQAFNVLLVARSDVPLRGMPIEVVFDPARLALVDVNEGDFLRQGDATVSVSKQIQPGAGRAVFGILRNVAQGARGTGVLATLQFKAVKPGSARIAVQAASAIGAPAGTSTRPMLPTINIEVRGQ